MTWLIIVVFLSGADPIARPIGLMVDAQSCQLAGAAMVAVMQAAQPQIGATFACKPQEEAH